MVDQAGWHLAKDLKTPDNITMMLLPSKSPELNPVENIWQFLNENWLSNRIFPSYNNILDHCCFAWNKLIPTAVIIDLCAPSPSIRWT